MVMSGGRIRRSPLRLHSLRSARLSPETSIRTSSMNPVDCEKEVSLLLKHFFNHSFFVWKAEEKGSR